MKAMICGSGGGISSDELTAINFNVLEGKTAVTSESDDEIATGTMPDRTRVDSSTGGINSNYPNTSIWKGNSLQFTTTTKGERLLGLSPQTGYYVGNGASYTGYKTRSVTLTPGATQQSVSSDSGNGILETVTVPAVSNLSSGNIKAGATVGGVAGTFSSDANAVAAHLLVNETAYVKGSKITGTMVNRGGSTTAVSYAYSGSSIYFRIPMGAYITADTNGTYPTIAVPYQDKSTTPTTSSQTISADSGKVLRNVTVNAIPGGYITTSDATATAAQILSGQTAYVKGSKITGTMTNVAAIDTAKSVGWDNDYGYIRMTNGAHITNATTGYPEVKVPYQNVTVTPSTSQQTVSPSDYSGKVLGNVFVNAIPNQRGQYQYGEMGFGSDYYAINQLPEGYYTSNGADWAPEARITKSKLQTALGVTASKIKVGESIADISGTFTSDANAGAGHILSGKTAYVNGNKITGNISSMSGGTYTPSTSQQTISCSGKYMTSNIIIDSITNPLQLKKFNKKLMDISTTRKSVDSPLSGSPRDIEGYIVNIWDNTYMPTTKPDPPPYDMIYFYGTSAGTKSTTVEVIGGTIKIEFYYNAYPAIARFYTQFIKDADDMNIYSYSLELYGIITKYPSITIS